MDFLIDQISFIPHEWKPEIKKQAMNLVAWGDWFCAIRDPRDIFSMHTSYLFNEILFYFCGLLTFIHAWRSGNRYWFTWIATVLHGLNTEALTYFVPDFENFWHAQTSLMFLGRRLPAHIILLYPMFDYTATIAAKRLRLPWWAEGCAVGLGAVLIDLPYDIMGVKLLWWTWHDTDPNIADRLYHVPWTSLYFHAAFACSFTLILNGMRKLLLPAEYDWKLFVREFICCLVAGTGAFWLGALQFIPVYHLLHDVFRVHSEICTLIFLGTYALIVWTADRHNKSRQKSHASEPFAWFDELFVLLVVHYFSFMALVLLAQPVTIQAVGLHEPIGPCQNFTPVQTVSGMVLSKRTYLCAEKYDEPYFNFNCPLAGGKPPVPRQSGEPIEWYTICGTMFKNHMEYVAVIWAFCMVGLYVFTQWLVFSGTTPTIPVKAVKRKKE